MAGTEAMHGPNSLGSHLPRLIWLLPLPNTNLLATETKTESTVWHHPLRKPAIQQWEVEYIGLLLSRRGIDSSWLEFRHILGRSLPFLLSRPQPVPLSEAECLVHWHGLPHSTVPRIRAHSLYSRRGMEMSAWPWDLLVLSKLHPSGRFGKAFWKYSWDTSLMMIP